MNWMERQALRLAWRRAMGKFPAIKRWVPLLSVAVLATGAILRGVGKVPEASALEQVAAFLGVVVTDPQVIAGIGAAVGLGFKVAAMAREASR